MLEWGESCDAGDDDYAIYFGAIGDFENYSPRQCSTLGALSLVFVPEPGDRFYLVVPQNAAREGFYGTGLADTDRPPPVSACLPQLVNSCR